MSHPFPLQVPHKRPILHSGPQKQRCQKILKTAVQCPLRAWTSRCLRKEGRCDVEAVALQIWETKGPRTAFQPVLPQHNMCQPKASFLNTSKTRTLTSHSVQHIRLMARAPYCALYLRMRRCYAITYLSLPLCRFRPLNGVFVHSVHSACTAYYREKLVVFFCDNWQYSCL